MIPAELDDKINQINELMVEVRDFKNDHPSFRCGVRLHPGSILNAYREGDLCFDAAVDMLIEWKGFRP